ncbi:hypothetical protein [Corallococcus sp. M7]
MNTTGRRLQMWQLMKQHVLPITEPAVTAKATKHGFVLYLDGEEAGSIDDVLACPESYAYPAATVAVVAKIAGEVLDQETLAKRIAVRRLHDSGATRLQESVSKLGERVS